MTTIDLNEIKQKLLIERERVRESLRRNTQHTFAEVDDSTRDAADLASASHDRDVFYRLQEADVKRLRLIDAVLSRIDDDGYGKCEQCGEEISKARLEAIPWAVYCLSCQNQTSLTEASPQTLGEPMPLEFSVGEGSELWKQKTEEQNKMEGL